MATLTAEISSALNDPGNVYWATAEIHQTIREGLLYWGALTSYWRARGAFQTVASPVTPFYDLSVQLPTLRARTYTFDDLTQEIQYHLLEPANGVAGTGMTDQFAIGQITASLKRKANEFDIDAPVTLTRNTFPILLAPGGRVTLDQSISLIKRAAWMTQATSVTTPLRRTDPYQAQSFEPLWNLNPGTPYGYSSSETQPIELQLVPPPLSTGALDLIYSETQDLTVAAGTVFPIPNEFVHAVKWAAVYEALATSGQGYDPIRARYCLERYDQYVKVSDLQRSILRVQVNDKPIPIDTLWNMDAARPFWQNRIGTPTMCACVPDMIAFSDVPSSVLGISCDVVRSAPLPVADGDFIQLGREEMPYLFDFCRHVLSFKLGGAEFTATIPLYDNFLAGAVKRNQILVAKARFLGDLFGQPQKESDIEAAA